MLTTPPYSVLGQARNTRTLNVSVVMAYLGRHLSVSRTGFAGFGWCFIGKNFPKTATVSTPSLGLTRHTMATDEHNEAGEHHDKVEAL
jgi:hypothetical protein